MRCCFTGHRKLTPDEEKYIRTALEEALELLLSDGEDCQFLTGGALGFDTLAAETVLQLRKGNPRVRLTLVLPCWNQTRGWPGKEIARYERIRAQADEVIYTAKTYYNGCMFRRNRYLVQHSDVCIAYLKPRTDRGGTRYTVEYSLNQEVPVVNLAQRFVILSEQFYRNVKNTM